MSKRQKHVFTCPDVIYLNDKHRRHNRNTAIGLVAAYAGLLFGGWIASKWVEKQEAAETTGETYNLSEYAEQR